MKKKYKVLLNWYGEIHTIYTSSKNKTGALNNSFYQLAKRTGYSRGYIALKFLGYTDNYKVKEVIE